MNFTDCIKQHKSILMECALGERLKREYHLSFDMDVVMAGLVYSTEGRAALDELWSYYAQIAANYHLPFLATTPTRRVNKDRVENSDFDASIIQENVRFLRNVLEQQTNLSVPMYVGGMIGCKGDAYTGKGSLTQNESQNFHNWEISRFATSNADFLYAALIPTLEEASGIALASAKYQIPYIISFTIQDDGCLVDGTRIVDAIRYIDELVSHRPVCYMTNCVHPKIVYKALSQPFNQDELVRERFLGIQANTSALSYKELDNASDLKTSDPVVLATDMLKLRELAPFQIFGGCCGTNNYHMEEIAKKLSPLSKSFQEKASFSSTI